MLVLCDVARKSVFASSVVLPSTLPDTPFWILDFGFWIHPAIFNACVSLVEVFAGYDCDFV